MINSTATTGSSAVDAEEQIDFARLRGERLARLKVQLDMSECGAILASTFPTSGP
ncbi:MULTISPECIES: hypothetical protein [Streptomyces]|uniref:hypothetical protein n=1 Tax=Streptomyces TaxID=1883 RepID=UPI00142DAC1B|nr:MULTISPECIES: hypothetical protein [Streptomyces]